MFFSLYSAKRIITILIIATKYSIDQAKKMLVFEVKVSNSVIIGARSRITSNTVKVACKASPIYE